MRIWLIIRFQAVIRPPHRKMADLVQTPLQGASYLHISPPFSAEDVAAFQVEIQRLLSTGTPGAWEPRLVFEPTPPSCHSGQRRWLEKVAPGIHVLSPNHEELLSFYGHPKLSFDDPMLMVTLEEVMRHLLDVVGVGADDEGILAVRCGRMGSCIGTRRGGLRWFPAYYTGEDEVNVKDVTGGELLKRTLRVALKLSWERVHRRIHRWTAPYRRRPIRRCAVWYGRRVVCSRADRTALYRRNGREGVLEWREPV